MKSRFLLIVIAALFGSAAVGLFIYIKNKQPETKIITRDVHDGVTKGQSAADARMVLVAKRDLTPGTLVSMEDFEYVEWVADKVNPSYFVKSDAAKLDPITKNQAVVHYQVLNGEPLKIDDLIIIGDKGSPFTGLIKGGMRGVSIPLSKVSNPNSFYTPGDRIDILLVKKAAGSGNNDDKVGRTVLRNLKIVAVDDSFYRTASKEGTKNPTIITVEVTPSQAVGLFSNRRTMFLPDNTVCGRKLR